MADEIKNLSSCTKIDGTEISYSRKDVLGSGTFGTVYLGIFEEKKVAIKKIQLKHQQSVKEDREVKNQLEAQGHENVASIFETVEDIDFRFIFSHLSII
jgi:serine/threonine protein kinase